MTDRPLRPPAAYENPEFLDRREARTLRILSEYLEPESRLRDQRVADTIVFLGSHLTPRGDDAEAAVAAARRGDGDMAAAERLATRARYYEDARELARRLTEWSKNLGQGGEPRRRFVVCTGGGPGIMEAANRGASEARGRNIGLNIAIPGEESDNPFITRGLSFQFRYFFMRKFWFLYLAKAIVVFPGGFGTLDELFEVLTLIQTGKLKKRMPVVLYGRPFWDDVIDFDAMVRHGTITEGDLNLFRITESLDEAFDFLTAQLKAHFLGDPGGTPDLG